MPFRPKGSRFYHYDFQIGGRRFHGSCRTDDFQEAKAVEAQARVAAKQSRKARGRFTVSEALGTYWSDICQNQASAATAKSQAKMLLAFIKPATPLPELTTRAVFKAVAKMRAAASNATVNRRIDMLARSIRHMAKLHGAEVPEIDWTAIKTREIEERIRELTFAEQARLFEHLRSDLQPFVKFALATGARRETIRSLRWSDVNHETGRLRFALKQGRSMWFPMNAEIRAILSAVPKSNTMAERGWVFTFVDRREGPRQGERRRVSDGGHIWQEWRAALDLAEIEDFRFHDCRHTFATRLLRQTGNLKLVSRLLGHTSIETTMRYAHVLDEDMATGMAAFSSLTPEVSPEEVEKDQRSQ